MNHLVFLSAFLLCGQLLLCEQASASEVNITRLEQTEALINSLDRRRLVHYDWSHDLWNDIRIVCGNPMHPYNKYCYLSNFYELWAYFPREECGIKKDVSVKSFFKFVLSSYASGQLWQNSIVLVYFGTVNITSFELLLQSTTSIRNFPTKTTRRNPTIFEKLEHGLYEYIAFLGEGKSAPIKGLDGFFHAMSNRMFEIVFRKISAFIHSDDLNVLYNYLWSIIGYRYGIEDNALSKLHTRKGVQFQVSRIHKYIKFLRFQLYNSDKSIEQFAAGFRDFLNLSCEYGPETPCVQDRALYESFGLNKLFHVDSWEKILASVNLTNMEQPTNELQKITLLFVHGSKWYIQSYRSFRKQFDEKISPFYINYIQNWIRSADMDELIVVKEWLANHLSPLCNDDQEQWNLCKLRPLYKIMSGRVIDLFNSAGTNLLDDTKENRVILDYLSKYPQNQDRMSYVQEHFNYLDGNISTKFLVRVSEIVRSSNKTQLNSLTHGIFKYLSLQIVPRICEKDEWKMCHLKNIYALIISIVSIEKGWQGGITSIHDLHSVDIERKLDVLVEEDLHVQTRSVIQVAANRIASRMDQNHDELVRSFGEQFSSLGSYFHSQASLQVGSFEKQVYLSRGTTIVLINEVSTQITPLVEDLRALHDIVTTITGFKIAKLFAEIALKTLEFIETVARNCNPFKLIFDGPDIAKVAKVANELVELAAKLSDQFTHLVKIATLGRKFQDLAIGLLVKLNVFAKVQEDNARILKLVRQFNQQEFVTSEDLNTFISSFLSIYRSFQGPMTDSDLVTLNSYTEVIIDYMCGLVEASDSGVDGASKIAAEEYCRSLQQKTSNIFSRLHEVVGELNIQFEKLADFARASVNLHSARQLSAYAIGLSKGTVTTSSFKVLEYASLSKLFHEDNIQVAAFQFCKFHEYREGVLPHMCTLARPYTVDQIRQMRSYVSPSTTAVELIPRIPTIQEMSIDGRMYPFVDLEALARGDDVTFTLPSWDFEWIKNHGWALPFDSGSTANFVETFELFLPLVHKTDDTITTHFLHIQTTAKSGSVQRLHSQSKSLFSIPTHQYIFEHSINQPRCRNHVYNPYHQEARCLQSDGLSSVCVVSEGITTTRQELFPSLLTEWTFRAKFDNTSYEIVKPAAGVQMDLLARVKVRRNGGSRERRSALRVHQPANDCCRNNQYKNFYGECVACPTNSTSALFGYTCQIDQIS